MDNSQLVCGDVTEVTNDEVVVVRYSKSKGKETARLRYDCLVICSGRRYPLLLYHNVYIPFELEEISTNRL